MKEPYKIGVLALQGAFSKHCEKLKALGMEAIEVRKPSDLKKCDGLIIPGGESTAILKHMVFIDFPEIICAFAKEKPIFGTCAGLILMSHEVLGYPMNPMSILDIAVERNAYGRQAESFITPIDLTLEKGKAKPFPAIFIRAPRIRSWGKDVQVMASYDNEPVLIKQGMHLGSTFHPELTNDLSIHRYFLEMIKKSHSNSN